MDNCVNLHISTSVKGKLVSFSCFFCGFQKHKNRYICEENHIILNVMIYKMFKKSSILKNVITVDNQEVVEACI